MNILIKFPTRERPERFFDVLHKYIAQAKDIRKIHFLITCDLDDKTMNNLKVRRRLEDIKKKNVNLLYFYGRNRSKIEAINNDMEKMKYVKWGIVLNASDDMFPQFVGYDELIRNSMQESFPDTDGILHFHDGKQSEVCTLSIMGRKYYERFNYIYHPSYKSLWCDNEYTDVANTLNKVKFIDKVIIKHEHYANAGVCKKDSLYLKNDQYWNADKANYNKRKELNFPQ